MSQQPSSSRKRPHANSPAGSASGSEDPSGTASEDQSSTASEDERSSKDRAEPYKFHQGTVIDTTKTQWSKYYTYLGHTKNNAMVWQCIQKSCNSIIHLSQTSKSNAVRHYQLVHQTTIGKKPSPKKFIAPLEFTTVMQQRRTSKQAAFDQAMTELIAQDGVPLSLPERSKFVSLVATLDPYVKVKSRRTYTRHIGEAVKSRVNHIFFNKFILRIFLMTCCQFTHSESIICYRLLI